MTCKRKRSGTVALMVLIALLWSVAAVLHAEPASAADDGSVSINAFLTPNQELYVEVLAPQYAGKPMQDGQYVAVSAHLQRDGEAVQAGLRNFDEKGYIKTSLGEVEGANYVSVEWDDNIYWTDIKRNGGFELVNRVMTADDRAKLLNKAKELEPYKARIALTSTASYYIDDKKRLWAFGELSPALHGSVPATREATQARKPKLISTITGVVQVAANSYDGAALTGDGQIWYWGNDDSWTSPMRIAKVPGAKQIQISSVGGLVLKQDGTVYAWDKPDPANAQPAAKQVKLTKIPQLQKVEKIRIGDYGQHIALTSDGTVWLWTRTSLDKNSMPELIKGLPKIVDLEPYYGSAFFISEHFDLWTLGGRATSGPVPKVLQSASDIVGIFKNMTDVKRADGSFTYYYQYAVDSKPDSNLNGVIAAEHATLGSWGGHTLAIGADGSLLAWGNNAYGQLGNGQPYPILFDPKPLKGIAQAELVAAGDNHTLAVTKNGKLYGWGSNRAHQINAESAAQFMTPRLIGTYSGVKKLQAGEDFSLLLMNNGQLYGWGNLQRIGLENADSPTLIDRFGQDKIADISAYERGAVILTANGDVYQMGGILYVGTVVEPEDFIWKVDIGQAKAIAAGSMRSYAVLKNGTVWSWKNIVQKKKYTAAQLPGFAKMATIAAGSRNGDFAIGLDEKGNPWAWGDNTARSLGHALPNMMRKGTDASAAPIRNFDAYSNGPIGKRDKPTYASVTAGSHGAILLTRSKEMLFFGYLSSPFRTGNLYQKADYVAAAGGNVFVISNGQLWAYGTNNDYGQLGNGTRAKYDTAQTVRFPK